MHFSLALQITAIVILQHNLISFQGSFPLLHRPSLMMTSSRKSTVEAVSLHDLS